MWIIMYLPLLKGQNEYVQMNWTVQFHIFLVSSIQSGFVVYFILHFGFTSAFKSISQVFVEAH